MISRKTNRDMSRTRPDCPGRDGQGHPPIRGVPCPGSLRATKPTVQIGAGDLVPIPRFSIGGATGRLTYAFALWVLSKGVDSMMASTKAIQFLVSLGGQQAGKNLKQGCPSSLCQKGIYWRQSPISDEATGKPDSHSPSRQTKSVCVNAYPSPLPLIISVNMLMAPSLTRFCPAAMTCKLFVAGKIPNLISLSQLTNLLSKSTTICRTTLSSCEGEQYSTIVSAPAANGTITASKQVKAGNILKILSIRWRLT